jgi:hypothetical protein
MLIDLKIVDLTIENPKVETDEGTIEGPTQYGMVVDLGANVQKPVELGADTYFQLHKIVTGE